MSLARAACLVAATALAASCQSGPPPAPGAETRSAALRNMEQVAAAAHRCWFASGDPAFRGYSFANELNSFTGRPRFLVVPRADFGGRPLLVVQAEGPAGRVAAFGPLLEGPHGARVSADIGRWSGGDARCAGSA